MIEKVSQLRIEAVGDKHSRTVGQRFVVDALLEHTVAIMLQAAAAGAPGWQVYDKKAIFRRDGDALCDCAAAIWGQRPAEYRLGRP